jgi:hypothetical protein
MAAHIASAPKVGGGARIARDPSALQTLTRELEDILKRDSKPLTLDARDKVNLRRAIEALHVLREDQAKHAGFYFDQLGEMVDLRIRLNTARQGMRDLLEAIE